MFSGFFQRRESGLRQECEAWFRATRHRLLAYARQQADDMTDVELLLAEVMQRVTVAFCSERVDAEGLMPYTLTTLRNAAWRARMKHARRRDAESRYCREAAERMSAAPGDAGRLQELRQLVRALPEEEAMVVTLRIWDERSFADIARELGVPESTVRRRYASALERIKTRMNQS